MNTQCPTCFSSMFKKDEHVWTSSIGRCDFCRTAYVGTKRFVQSTQKKVDSPVHQPFQSFVTAQFSMAFPEQK